MGEGSPYKLSASIQGLASPAIRVGDGLYAGRDGGFVSGHFYGHRTIVLNGFYVGKDCADAAELRETLFGLLRIRYNLPIVIYTDNGNYYIEGVIKDVKADIDNVVAGEYQITILCPHPILYLLDGGTSEENTWISDDLNIGSVTTIGNSGNVDDYPVLVLNKQMVDPVFTNTTTGKFMKLTGTFSASTSQLLVIDMAKRIITLDGEVKNALRTPDSSWWALIPGQNEIEVKAAVFPASTMTIKHRRGRAGI